MNSRIFISNLPQGFVYLKSIDSTIIQNLRYFTSENFIGSIIPGYKSSNIILTEQAAEALKNAHKDLKNQGYKLVVYDAYRPVKTVQFFRDWSKDINQQSMKNLYYPNINKTDLFKYDYIAEKSGHSRGSTVDLTIIPINDKLYEIKTSLRQLNNNLIIPFLDDGTVDMGSSFDLFHEVSHHDCNLISKQALNNRNFLRRIMKKHGFKEICEEWWHYTFVDEPYPNTYFDFDVN